MTKEEARKLLINYFNSEFAKWGSVNLPKNDIVFPLGTNNGFEFSEVTFRGLLMIAYDLKEKE